MDTLGECEMEEVGTARTGEMKEDQITDVEILDADHEPPNPSVVPSHREVIYSMGPILLWDATTILSVFWEIIDGIWALPFSVYPLSVLILLVTLGLLIWKFYQAENLHFKLTPTLVIIGAMYAVILICSYVKAKEEPGENFISLPWEKI